jgi:hypothetical protein
MDTKIQLLHPAGKNAFKIDAGKYNVMSRAIIQCLKKQALTHKDLLDAINAYFKKDKIKFEGSVEWYMEGVKLDLEAKKILKRIKEDSKLKFQLNRK